MTIEGTGGGQSVVDRMRATQDAGEKMRLAFMLLKLGPSEVPALERALAAEQDPMIRKYIVRALGEASGSADPAAGGGDPAGLETLQKMASAGDDRQLRIEAIRAIERRSSPEVSKFLAELAAQEDGKDAQIRSIAIRALANVGGAEQGDFFTQVLQRDDRVNNRAEAAKFFARAGTGRDLAVLEPLAQKEQVHYIKEKLDTAVEQIKKREGIR
jgi:HEAT repeat protein